MKKIFCLFLSVLILLPSFVSCAPQETDGSFDIVCTVFPIYDWVRSCLGDAEGVNVTLLVDNGTDPHSFSPSSADAAEIYSCDMLIYVGGESDSWVTDALEARGDDKPCVLPLLELLGERVIEHEHTETVHSHGHEHEHDSGSAHGAYDEHVWLSVKNASYLCDKISDELARLLPNSADIIAKNSEEYINKLNELDSKYETAIASCESRFLLFADRFPFEYLVHDYGLEYYAAFSGCSTDVEATFETVISLIYEIDAHSLPYVLTLESSNGDLARTAISESRDKNATVLAIDSMQSIGKRDIESGLSYIGVMENNLDVIKTALSFGK